MGDSSIGTPRAKFYNTMDVANLFPGRTLPPALFHKTAWWHFVGMTVPGGETGLLRAYSDIVSMFRDLNFQGFPIVESPSEALTEADVEDLATLWPVLTEQA